MSDGFTPDQRRLLRRALADPLAFYRPRPGQFAFHEDPSKRRLVRGPNQIVGKSYCGSAEWLWWAEHRHPYRDTPEGAVDGVLIPYSDKSVKEIERGLFALMPKDSMHARCKYSLDHGFTVGGTRMLLHKNGSNLVIATSKGGTMSIAGGTKHVAWFDEPPEASGYGEGTARVVDRKGDIWMTMTPIGRPVAFIKEEVATGKFSETYIPPTPENTGKTQAELDEICAGYLAAERPQRFYGEWEGVTPERLLSAYTDAHIFDDEDEDVLPTRPLSIGIGFDWAERSMGTAAVLVAFDRNTHEMWSLDEYESQGKTTADQDASAILAMLDRHNIRLEDVDEARGDTNSAGKSRLTTINRLMSECLARAAGVPEHAISSGHMPLTIRGARKGPGSVFAGARTLNRALAGWRWRIHRRCVRSIAGCRHWKGQKTGRGSEVKDMLDATRYIGADVLDTRTKGGMSVRLR